MVNQKNFVVFSILFVLTLVFAQAPSGFVLASPIMDAGPTITPTFTSVPATITPTETATTAPYPAAPTQPLVAESTQTESAPGGESNVPDRTGDASAVAAGSSVLGFLLCAGVIIVAGLAALNVWARRRP
jgi:hypothetical protein